MNLSHYCLKSLTDPKWMEDAITEMGEEKFRTYYLQIYKTLEDLKIGERLMIEKWVKPERYYLFIKISCCFFSETECCYEFNSDYTIITHKFDKYETLVHFTKKIPVQALS